MKCHKCETNENLIKFSKDDYSHSTLVKYSEDGIYCCTKCYKQKNAMTRFVLMFQTDKIKSLYGLEI